jgi:hypothetical protein
VSPGTVSVEVEWRKKKIGDDAESWAVTAMTKTLLDLDYPARCQAIEALESMLDTFGFTGTATERVHGFARAATEADLDQETIIDRLTEFLHVSAYAVLAVRRDPGTASPAAMDLLIDPVQLCEDGKIDRDVDTYRMRYTVPK